jgi:hypothetical protein
MVAEFFSETSVDFRQTIRRYVPEDRNVFLSVYHSLPLLHLTSRAIDSANGTEQTTNNKIPSLLWRKFCIRNRVTRVSGRRTTAPPCLLHDTVYRALELEAVHLADLAHR